MKKNRKLKILFTILYITLGLYWNAATAIYSEYTEPSLLDMSAKNLYMDGFLQIMPLICYIFAFLIHSKKRSIRFAMISLFVLLAITIACTLMFSDILSIFS